MQLGKIAIGAGVVVCAMAAIYGYAYYKYPPGHGSNPPVVATAPPAPVAATPATPAPATPAPAPPAPAAPPVAEATPAPAPPTTRMLYQRCVQGAFPTPEDAEWRNADCSAAIMSRELTPDELALARLIRGSARAALGDKVMAGDDYMEALKRYDSLIDSQNSDALNLFRRAVAADAVGNTDKALADFNQAIRLDPQATLAFLGRGVLLATRKRSYERAIADFDKVLVLEPDNVLALIRRGEALSQLGETGRGLADLDRAVARAPRSSQAYFQRGLIHSRRNETADAFSDYNAALERNPRSVEALTSRAAIYSIDRKLDLAIRDLNAAIALKLMPANLDVRDTRGFIYLKLGDAALALNE